MLLAAILCACKTDQHQSTDFLKSGKQVSFQYAKGLKIIEFKNYTYVKVLTPNDSDKVFGEYILYKKDKPSVPISIDGYIQIPVKRAAPLSTTHIGFISQLKKEESIAGVTDPFRIFNPKVRQALAENKIANLGQSLSTDIEKVLALSPDVVIESGFPDAGNKNQTLHRAGIPVIYTVDWMEPTALARAEWIKLFGYLYDMKDEANSFFSDISKEYLQLRESIDHAQKKTVVFSGNSFKGVWYLPGGNSYMAKLIEDAGGKYIMQNDTSAASLPVSFEVVFDKISEADIWINVEENSIASLVSKDERLMHFPPVSSGRVYNRNLNFDGLGANAYFEDGICNPQKILSDLIAIFHPDLMGDNFKLNYYQQLSND